MLLWAEGFDDLSNATDLLYRMTADDNQAPSTITTGRQGNGYAMRHTWGASYQGTTKTFPSITTTAIFGMAMEVEVYTTADYKYFRVLGALASRIMEVRFRVVGYLHLYDAAATLLAVIPGFKDFNSYVEFKLTPGAVGHLTIRLDGVVVFDADGNFTDGAGTPGVTGLHWGGFAGVSDLKVDDVYLCDDTGTYNNDFLGDIRVLSSPPNDDGYYAQMNPSTGADHFALVDEYPINTTDYVDADTVGEIDTYLYPGLDATIGDILAVQFMMYSKLTAGGVGELSGFVRNGSSDYVAAVANTVQAVWQGLAVIYEEDPDTSAPWTVAGVDASEFGMKKTL
jgi:hypothetical protein